LSERDGTDVALAPGAPLGAWLKERALAAGFDDAAVVAAAVPLPDAERFEAAIAEGRLAPFPWMEETAAQRADARRRWPWVKSVLVCVQSYYAGDHAEHVGEEALATRAKVARYAWGSDYHHVLRRRLRRLRKELLARVGGGTCAPFCDVDAVLERAWAKAAGLGFTGKSGLFIHPRLGTWTFLSGLVTDIDLFSSPTAEAAPLPTPIPIPIPMMCGTCTACLDACPTQAIRAPGVVDARRCLTTWNVEETEDARGEAPDMVGHGWAVGCDVCQEVCPWNRFQRRTTEPKLQPKPGHVAFGPDDAPTDVEGTPLARPGKEALPGLAQRALSRVRR
jgi:epoxyqueuosine reductase